MKTETKILIGAAVLWLLLRSRSQIQSTQTTVTNSTAATNGTTSQGFAAPADGVTPVGIYY